MLHVIATVELNPGTKDSYLAELKAVTPAVRAEDGCIQYEASTPIATDISTNKTVDPDAVVILEKWRDFAALKAHLGAPHMAVYRARPDVGAVIHSHSPHASAFAVAGQAIPCLLDEQVLTLGGRVEVAEVEEAAGGETRAEEASRKPKGEGCDQADNDERSPEHRPVSVAVVYRDDDDKH